MLAKEYFMNLIFVTMLTLTKIIYIINQQVCYYLNVLYYQF